MSEEAVLMCVYNEVVFFIRMIYYELLRQVFFFYFARLSILQYNNAKIRLRDFPAFSKSANFIVKNFSTAVRTILVKFDVTDMGKLPDS